MIDQGKVIATGTSGQLKDRVGGDVLEFTVVDPGRIEDAKRAVVELSPTEPILDPKSAKISVTVGQYGTNALARTLQSHLFTLSTLLDDTIFG